MFALPLQALDNFLLNYNLGQVLLVVFVLAVLFALVQHSGKILAIQAITFGLLFALVPSIDGPTTYIFLGVGLMMVAPLIYVSSGK